MRRVAQTSFDLDYETNSGLERNYVRYIPDPRTFKKWRLLNAHWIKGSSREEMRPLLHLQNAIKSMVWYYGSCHALFYDSAFYVSDCAFYWKRRVENHFLCGINRRYLQPRESWNLLQGKYEPIRQSAKSTFCEYESRKSRTRMNLFWAVELVKQTSLNASARRLCSTHISPIFACLIIDI